MYWCWQGCGSGSFYSTGYIRDFLSGPSLCFLSLLPDKSHNTFFIKPSILVLISAPRFYYSTVAYDNPSYVASCCSPEKFLDGLLEMWTNYVVRQQYFYYLIHIFSSKFVCVDIFSRVITVLYRCWQGCESGSFYIRELLSGPSPNLVFLLPDNVHNTLFIKPSIFVFISNTRRLIYAVSPRFIHTLLRLHNSLYIHLMCLTPLLQFREVSGRSARHVDELRGAAAGRPGRLRHAGLPHLLPLLTLQRDHRQQAVRHVAR